MKKKEKAGTDKSIERRPVRRCQADAETGLTKEQVREYMEAGWKKAEGSGGGTGVG